MSTSTLSALAATPVDESIPEGELQVALSSPPFLVNVIPGSLNLRDPGTYSPLQPFLRPHTVFRSGTLDILTPHERSLLRSRLGISLVVDFRRADEIKSPSWDGTVEGLKLLSLPYKEGTEQPPDSILADFIPQEDGSPGPGYADMYDVVLEGYTTGYRAVFEFLRTAREGDAVLFHCTAGKDRTGIMTALILDLLDAPANAIADEYALTRVGTEPWRETLLPFGLRSISLGPQASKTGSGSASGRSADTDTPVEDQSEIASSNTITIDTPGAREMLGTYAAVMKQFVERLRRDYGGAAGYMKNYLDFSDEDIGQIRNNLRPRL